jgi:TonB family protein
LTAGGPRTTVLRVRASFAGASFAGARAWARWGKIGAWRAPACALCLVAACASGRSFYDNDPPPFEPGPPGFLAEPSLPPAGPGRAAEVTPPAAPRSSAPLAPDIDIPCSAGPQALLPALEARIMHRVRPPIGLVPLSIAGSRAAGGLQVKVVMEIDRRGTIRRSAVASSSGIGELDRAVLNAIDEAACMPVPSRALLDERSGTFKVSLGYLFGRS